MRPVLFTLVFTALSTAALSENRNGDHLGRPTPEEKMPMTEARAEACTGADKVKAVQEALAQLDLSDDKTKQQVVKLYLRLLEKLVEEAGGKLSPYLERPPINNVFANQARHELEEYLASTRQLSQELEKNPQELPKEKRKEKPRFDGLNRWIGVLKARNNAQEAPQIPFDYSDFRFESLEGVKRVLKEDRDGNGISKIRPEK